MLSTKTLIERNTGSGWAIVSSPNDTSARYHDVLNGVARAAATDCWAVGTNTNHVTGIAKTLIERDIGSGWGIVSSPNTDIGQSNYLNGVACAAADDCWAVGYSHNSSSASVDQTLIEHYAVPPVPLNSVVSRKTHGNAGTFDINLPLTGAPDIECRSGGANGDYTLVFTFANNLTNVGSASVTSGTGMVGGSGINGSNPREYLVNLTGVTNAQTITVSLTNVTDSSGNSSAAVGGSMGVLVGDTTADRSVNSADISQTKSQSGQSVTASNFRQDVTVDGSINSADISLVKSKSGTALP